MGIRRVCTSNHPAFHLLFVQLYEYYNQMLDQATANADAEHPVLKQDPLQVRTRRRSLFPKLSHALNAACARSPLQCHLRNVADPVAGGDF